MQDWYQNAAQSQKDSSSLPQNVIAQGKSSQTSADLIQQQQKRIEELQKALQLSEKTQRELLTQQIILEGRKNISMAIFNFSKQFFSVI